MLLGKEVFLFYAKVEPKMSTGIERFIDLFFLPPGKITIKNC